MYAAIANNTTPTTEPITIPAMAPLDRPSLVVLLKVVVVVVFDIVVVDSLVDMLLKTELDVNVVISVG